MNDVMGTEFSPLHTNFSVGFLEEEVLFLAELPK